MRQLNLGLFQEEITEDYLLNYLQTNYPEMKFVKTVIFDNDVIVSTNSNKAVVKVGIVRRDEDFTYWSRPKEQYISLDLNKKYGDFEGIGLGDDTLDEFKTDVAELIEKAKQFIEDYKNRK